MNAVEFFVGDIEKIIPGGQGFLRKKARQAVFTGRQTGGLVEFSFFIQNHCPQSHEILILQGFIQQRTDTVDQVFLKFGHIQGRQGGKKTEPEGIDGRKISLQKL